jgi:hypothetical protein
MTAAKQEPRPAYHRRQDLARLQRHADGLPVRLDDNGTAYQVWLLPLGETLLLQGRHEVIAAYLTGWRHALGLSEAGQGDRPEPPPQ